MSTGWNGEDVVLSNSASRLVSTTRACQIKIQSKVKSTGIFGRMAMMTDGDGRSVVLTTACTLFLFSSTSQLTSSTKPLLACLLAWLNSSCQIMWNNTGNNKVVCCCMYVIYAMYVMLLRLSAGKSSSSVFCILLALTANWIECIDTEHRPTPHRNQTHTYITCIHHTYTYITAWRTHKN